MTKSLILAGYRLQVQNPAPFLQENVPRSIFYKYWFHSKNKTFEETREQKIPKLLNFPSYINPQDSMGSKITKNQTPCTGRERNLEKTLKSTPTTTVETFTRSDLRNQIVA